MRERKKIWDEVNLKGEPSLVVIEDHHHYNKKRQTIENLEGKGSDKVILVLNTDKHNRVWIVTPDVIIELRSGKGRKHKHSTDVRIMPELWDEKTRTTLRLSSFDDMRELNMEVEGERIKDKWISWFEDED